MWGSARTTCCSSDESYGWPDLRVVADMRTVRTPDSATTRLVAMAMAMIAISLTPYHGVAQNVGDRVRVTIGDTTVIGDVTRVSQDGLDVDMEDARSRTISFSDVTLLERGRIGGVDWKVGLASGVIAAAAGAGWCVNSDQCALTDFDLGTWMEFGGTLALVGLAGSPKSWEWETIPPGLPALTVPNTGVRVRVTSGAVTLVGELASLSQNELSLNVGGGGSRSMPLSQVQVLERSLGTGTHWQRGLLIGLAGGASVAATYILSKNSDDIPCAILLPIICWFFLPPLDAGEPFLVTSGLGLVGLGIGALMKTESWETIVDSNPGSPANKRLRPLVDLRYHEGRFGLVLGGHIRF